MWRLSGVNPLVTLSLEPLTLLSLMTNRSHHRPVLSIRVSSTAAVNRQLTRGSFEVCAESGAAVAACEGLVMSSPDESVLRVAWRRSRKTSQELKCQAATEDWESFSR
jgi:hypothetical protein